jgi:hypothetical protein
MIPNRPCGKQVSFGQGPRPEASVTGPVGAFYYFNAVKFDPGVEVKVEIFDGRGRCVYSDKKVTDSNGCIGGMWSVKPGTPGQYKFIATGKCDRRVQAAEKIFDVSV